MCFVNKGDKNKMVICAIYGCSKRSGRDDVSFYRIPVVNMKRKFKFSELLLRRQKLWITRIRRKDLDAKKIEHARICSVHFISGKPSSLEDSDNPDWAPSINLGYGRESNTEDNVERNSKNRMRYNALPSKLWKRDETTALIALYETERCLYDTEDSDYYDADKRKDAYRRILEVMVRIRPHITIKNLRNRLRCLRSQYSAELQRKKLAIQTGLCTEETFKSTIWFFDLLEFLQEYITPTEVTGVNSDESEGENEKGSDSESKSVEHFVTNNEADTGNNSEFNNEDEHVNTASKINCEDNSELIVHKENTSKKRKLRNSESPNKENTEEKILKQTSLDREDIFGQYVASEMKALRENPVLYLQTKQAILEILTSANFELINPD